MSSSAILCLALLLPSDAPTDAKQLAQDILNKGSALFDTRDAAAMTATFTEDARSTLIGKDKATTPIKTEVFAGRDSNRKGYEDIFRWREPGTTSRNVVDFARLVGDDMLIIQGTFIVDTRKPKSSIPFVQIRVKRGDKWLILSVQLFIATPGDAANADPEDCVVD